MKAVNKKKRVDKRACERAIKMMKQCTDKLCCWGMPVAFVYKTNDSNLVTYGAGHMHAVLEKYKEEIINGNTGSGSIKYDTPDTSSHVLLPALDKGLKSYNFAATRDLAVAVVRADKGDLRRRIGWGLPQSKPVWWPHGFDWSRRGVQSGFKQAQLQTIIRAAYSYHGQEAALEPLPQHESPKESEETCMEPMMFDNDPLENIDEMHDQVNMKTEHSYNIESPVQCTLNPTFVPMEQKPFRVRGGNLFNPSQAQPSTISAGTPEQTVPNTKSKTIPIQNQNSVSGFETPLNNQSGRPRISTPCQQIGDQLYPIEQIPLNQSLGPRIRTVHLPAEKEIIILIADSNPGGQVVNGNLTSGEG